MNVVLSHDTPQRRKPKVQHSTTCVTQGDFKQAALAGSWCQHDLRESGMKKQKKAANCPLKMRAVDTDRVKCPELKPRCEENKIKKKCPFTCFKCDPSKYACAVPVAVYSGGVNIDTPTSLGAVDFIFWCGTLGMPDSVRLSCLCCRCPRVRNGDPTALLTVGANASIVCLVYLISCVCCRAPG